MRFVSLFAGIGGIDLGLEWAGWTCVAQVENDPYAKSVLRRHWPSVRQFDDVRVLNGHQLPPHDVIVGGFPCQDVSLAGKGAGIEGARTGLWSEFHRLVGECRPRWIVAENVPGLRNRGADRVLGDLEALGYTSWPLVVGAEDVGAHHRRKRVFIVARRHVADADREGQLQQEGSERALGGRAGDGGDEASTSRRGWTAEPAIRRMAHGVPARMDRLRCLGNAVVPQVAQAVGEAINAVVASGVS